MCQFSLFSTCGHASYCAGYDLHRHSEGQCHYCKHYISRLLRLNVAMVKGQSIGHYRTFKIVFKNNNNNNNNDSIWLAAGRFFRHQPYVETSRRRSWSRAIVSNTRSRALIPRKCFCGAARTSIWTPKNLWAGVKAAFCGCNVTVLVSVERSVTLWQLATKPPMIYGIPINSSVGQLGA